MDKSRDPFGLALAALRTRLRAGEWVLGERLMAPDLCRQLQLSPTPVREALSRLAGEGLIEARRGGGYFAWRLDTVDLAELYALQGAFLAEALGDEGAGRCEAGMAQAASDPAGAIEATLLALIEGGRNLALVRLQAALADRLAPARRVEGLVFPDLAEEAADLARLAAKGERDGLLAWLGRYRSRRTAQAAVIVAAMRSAGGLRQ